MRSRRMSPFAAFVRSRASSALQVALSLGGPERAFRIDSYIRHNQRRQEHLATLGLRLAGRTVLEVGAGIGDHTSFFLDRGCTMTVTDGRPENVAHIKRRFPDQDVRLLDLDSPDSGFQTRFELVYCYGVLYHLSDPQLAITYLADRCTHMLLLETCVSMQEGEAINPTSEHRNPTQALTIGCRPTRLWVWRRLAECFPYVYATNTQPWHDEFPTDWSEAKPTGSLTRAVFVASRTKLEVPTLQATLPVSQARC